MSLDFFARQTCPECNGKGMDEERFTCHKCNGEKKIGKFVPLEEIFASAEVRAAIRYVVNREIGNLRAGSQPQASSNHREAAPPLS